MKLKEGFMSKTWNQKPEEVQRAWKILDASGKSLGRLASVTAKLLMGKDKPQFTSHIMGGDFVIVINSDKININRKKMGTKNLLQPFSFCRFIKREKS